MGNSMRARAAIAAMQLATVDTLALNSGQKRSRRGQWIEDGGTPSIPRASEGGGAGAGGGAPHRSNRVSVEEVHGQALLTLLAELEAEQVEEFDLLGEFISRLPEQLQEYWTTGEGGAKIRWCTPGAFERGRRALRKYVTNPDMLDGLVANLYHRACGRWPGEKKD